MRMMADPSADRGNNSEPRGRPDIDMSPAAIWQRLDELSQLHELGQYLAPAKLIGPVNPLDAHSDRTDEQ